MSSDEYTGTILCLHQHFTQAVLFATVDEAHRASSTTIDVLGRKQPLWRDSECHEVQMLQLEHRHGMASLLHSFLSKSIRISAIVLIK